MKAADFNAVQRVIDRINDQAKRAELTQRLSTLRRGVAEQRHGLYPRTELGSIQRDAERWMQIYQ